MKIILLCFGFLVSMRSFSQSNSCNCRDNFLYLTSSISKNYAGFKDKVNSETKSKYQGLVDSLSSVAAEVNDTENCFALLATYVNFFNDKHLQIRQKSANKRLRSSLNASEIELLILPDKTVYIKMSSLKIKNKAVLDSLIRTNRKQLAKSKYWIIDLRNNNGGSTDVYTSLLPYLYTRPFYSQGSSHLLTKDNVDRLEQFLLRNRNSLDQSTIDELETRISSGRKNPGMWYKSRPDTILYSKIYKKPSHVSVLVNANTASSAESFLVLVKNFSDKVVVMGQNTGRYLDYGDLLPYNMPCDRFALSIPSRRANYLDKGFSYDKTGFQPDIYIPANVDDWLDFAIRNQKKK